MKEILPDIHTWYEFSEEKQLKFNGYLLVCEGESVLIDPPRMSEKNFSVLDNLAGRNSSNPLSSILLTNIHHERDSDEFRKRFGANVWINEKDSTGLEGTVNRTFNDGERLPGGLTVINFENQKSPGESAFFIKERGIMIVGDAFIGKFPGRVNMLPPEKYRDFESAEKGLKKILSFEFESLLVGDGESILKSARQAVKSFLGN